MQNFLAEQNEGLAKSELRHRDRKCGEILQLARENFHPRRDVPIFNLPHPLAWLPRFLGWRWIFRQDACLHKPKHN